MPQRYATTMGPRGHVADRLDDDRVWPSYGQSCIANVPATVGSLLGVDTDRPLQNEAIARLQETPIDHVVLLVIDGLGWHRCSELRESIPALDLVLQSGAVSPLTSTYPSETAAAMFTLYTGLQPVEHGLIGWFTRFDDPTTIAHSLPFRSLDGDALDEATGHDPDTLVDLTKRTPIPTALAEAGVEVCHISPTKITDSHASRLAVGPCELFGYDRLEDAFETVADRITTAGDRTYHLVYDPTVDAAGHHHGTKSAAYHDATAETLTALYDRFLAGLDDGTAERTAVLLVADHGQVDTSPEINVDLAALEGAGNIDLRTHLEPLPNGDPIYLAGGPRNVQLHLKPDRVETVRRELEASLSATTLSSDEYRARALFGDREPSELFDRRAPDLLLIPDEGGIWYDDGQLDYIGMHGGLSPAEMVVPLITGLAADLR